MMNCDYFGVAAPGSGAVLLSNCALKIYTVENCEMENVMGLKKLEDIEALATWYMNYVGRELENYWSDMRYDVEMFNVMDGEHHRWVGAVRNYGTSMMSYEADLDDALLTDEEAAKAAFENSAALGLAVKCVVVVVSYEDGSYDASVFERVEK